MLKVAYFGPQRADGPSFFYGENPLGVMHRDGQIELLVNYEERSWDLAARIHVAVFSRAWVNCLWELWNYFGECGVRRVLMLDDDMSVFQPDNICIAHFKAPGGQFTGRYEALLESADQVWCASRGIVINTKALVSNPNKVVRIPLAINEQFFTPQTMNEDNKVIFWRGGSPHLIDLLAHEKALVELMDEYPDWRWVFCGQVDVPSILRHQNCEYMARMHQVAYYRMLETLRPRIWLTPLSDTDFNKTKAPTGWREGSYAGANVVLPAWHQNDIGIFNAPNAFTYETQDEFKAQVKQLIERPDPWAVKAAQNLIKETTSMSIANRMRLEALEKIC